MNTSERPIMNTTNTIARSRGGRHFPTPNLDQLLKLDGDVEALQRQRDEVLDRMVSDCEFMDVPVLKLSRFDARSRDLSIGKKWHVLTQDSERDPGYTSYFGHLAETCRNEGWCSQTGVAQRGKYEREGSRFWHTLLGEYVLAGVPSNREGVHTLIPVAI
jgi:hypothetical protein